VYSLIILSVVQELKTEDLVGLSSDSQQGASKLVFLALGLVCVCLWLCSYRMGQVVHVLAFDFSEVGELS
jgi:hypothetical protein